MKKQIREMTGEEREKFVRMSGCILLWISEGRSIKYMCDMLNLSSGDVEFNIDEILYVIKKRVGIWRFVKILFTK